MQEALLSIPVSHHLLAIIFTTGNGLANWSRAITRLQFFAPPKYYDFLHIVEKDFPETVFSSFSEF